ncbi:hypothetical protein LNKW23_39800 [Paralimibaculum aggregatum]|uniref:ABC transmembrane type-1 domain-containing protein n=1 Tax=Paralimibaculum aggregatum TaxID=3036245 RepID=A0ABQ6LS44_9RHOB|nr:ABC transporter permease [Limibaculum sp. NKW23]GMG84764.1 hypothetical protein LNKW23_39800 [Limibaculum sp. NKW23]
MSTTAETLSSDAPSPEAQEAASETDARGRLLAADGTPLKLSLARALRRQKLRALALVAPLLFFVLVSFIFPIGGMLLRSVQNDIVPDTLPRTIAALEDWDPASDVLPGEPAFAALYTDLVVATERKTHTRLGSRLNYAAGGYSSMLRKSGRLVADFHLDWFEKKVSRDWDEPEVFTALFGEGEGPAAQALPKTAAAYAAWAEEMREQGEDPAKEEPWDLVYAALVEDLRAGGPALTGYSGPQAELIAETLAKIGEYDPPSYTDAFIKSDKDWGDPDNWAIIHQLSGRYTSSYFLAAADLERNTDGEIVDKPEEESIYIFLFERTLFLSLTITFSCLLLGYPIAWLLSNLPLRISNLLLILVLLPFWTSLLVRTSAWIVLLQQEGVINDLLVSVGILSDSGRLQMMFNQTGTIIAMTHILLPFMILPLYSVMKTIKPNYLRAAKSLGATDWTAFWRVYFPNTVPGIGAGAILVFILSIGYYITPELVGGTEGVFISNRIAYHISSSLNWGLAAALASLLLIVVLALYWVYDRIVGIDNVKLG